MLDTIIKYIVGEFRMIADAPVSYVVAVLGAAFLIWFAMDWRYGGIISNKESEITLIKSQRDDYHDKLGGASPDQAKTRMDALERRLAQIEPRRLTQEQQTRLASMLRAPTQSASIEILRDGVCVDCERYAGEFNMIFSAAGWRTSTPMAIGWAISGRPRLAYLRYRQSSTRGSIGGTGV